MSLCGTHSKNESLIHKGSFAFRIYRLCRFLSILEIKGFLRGRGKERMHKKAAFYTYAPTRKYSLYGKNMLSFIYSYRVTLRSNLTPMPLENEIAFYFVNDNKYFDLL